MNMERHDETYVSLSDFIRTWNKVCDYQDTSTKDHSRRTRDITVVIAALMGYKDEELLHISYAADIHDIGKLAIDPYVLRQASKLTKAQRASVEKHPEYGADMLRYANLPQTIMDGVMYHHEHWDGTGYPYKLKGEAIPMVGRIICPADMWDSLISDRPYRKALSRDVALGTMNSCAQWFDAEVFAVLLKLIREGKV